MRLSGGLSGKPEDNRTARYVSLCHCIIPLHGDTPTPIMDKARRQRDFEKSLADKRGYILICPIPPTQI